MTFILRRRSPYVFGLFPFKFFNDNKDAPDPKTVEKYIKNKDENVLNETGKDRLRKMFSKNEYGEISPEIRYCMHIGSMAFIFGAIYGGVLRGRSAFIHFIDSNEATMFRNHLDAKRQLQDQVSLSVFKGAAQWSWRSGFFTSVYAITSTVVSVFRGKSGVIEHVDGGFMAGAVYNMKNGVRGAIVGGGLGGVLGAFFGSIFYGFLLLTGQTVEEVRFWTYEWNKHREDLYAEGDRKYRIKRDEEAIMKLAEQLTESELQMHAPKKENILEAERKSLS
ncbi:RPII140-upstream gene protein [Belonocnema kinseyi]|uniref:RPII140-upstream gene protein n=1 Tax=Belonocnema kinseyi TaxID=2817044 RepID=UPI00143DAAFF|nr:RPII140-upstream gene protein [Belonocnema kinseyi]